MARIAIIHSALNGPLGGAEKLCIETIQALQAAGHSVDLVSTGKTDHGMIRKLFATDFSTEKELVSWPPLTLPSTIYSRYLHWITRDAFFVPHLKKNYDLTITTKPLLPLAFTDIIYMHFLNFPGSLEIFYKKYQKGYSRLYALPHDFLTKISIDLFNLLESKPNIVTNSVFSKSVIKCFLNVDPLVVHPPVDVEDYINLSQLKNRENIVLTISRIDEDKGLEIVPQIASQLKDTRFVILGTVSSQRYFQRLLGMIKQLNVEETVKLIPNASHEVKRILLSKCKVFLHPMRYEHFGISPVEAMSAGLALVVNKSGGPWTDILDRKQGVYGYSYEGFHSCLSCVDQLIHDDKLRTSLTERSVERSKRFSRAVYKERMTTIVAQLLKTAKVQ